MCSKPIAEIFDAEKIKIGQIVVINVDNQEAVKGIITEIYASNLQQTNYRNKDKKNF